MAGADSTLKSKFAVALTVALLAECILYYSAFGSEKTPQSRPLDFFATDLGGWHMTRQGRVEKEVQDVLRADDSLTRKYAKASLPAPVSFFVAYFKTQRSGQAPHSPKNCLPGSGFEPLQEGVIEVNVPGQAGPIQINRYLVARGENASVVLYWYQSRSRVVSSEYAAKIWLVLDSIRYHRSDTAMVRVAVPVVRGDDAAATRAGVDFIQAMFPVLKAYLPM